MCVQVLRISTSKHGKDVSDDAFAKLLVLLDNITTARKVFSSKKVKAEGLRFEAVPYFNSEMAFSGKLSGLEVRQHHSHTPTHTQRGDREGMTEGDLHTKGGWMDVCGVWECDDVCGAGVCWFV